MATRRKWKWPGIGRASRVAATVRPRVTRERAIQALKRSREGARMIARLRAAGVQVEPSAVTQTAYFTARTRSGNAGPIDFWNVDLRFLTSELRTCYDNDQVYFDVREKTAYDNINLHHPNGVVQAFFGVEEPAYVLIVCKVSSADAKVRLKIDGDSLIDFHVQGNGVVLPMLRSLTVGVHRINLIQRGSNKPFWFHSITCFLV